MTREFGLLAKMENWAIVYQQKFTEIQVTTGGPRYEKRWWRREKERDKESIQEPHPL